MGFVNEKINAIVKEYGNIAFLFCVQMVVVGAGGQKLLVPRRAGQAVRPVWHAPWGIARVIAGHLGWVRCIALDPTNSWFATGSVDRIIKVLSFFPSFLPSFLW